MELRNNPLLLGTFILGASYWIIAPLIENFYLSLFFAMAVTLSSAAALPELAINTFYILFFKKRSMDEQGRGRGSHLAVYGMFLFTFGSVFSGCYGLYWNINGQPTSWIGSAESQFGRACHTAGFILMQFGPTVTKEGFALDRRWWVTVISAAFLVAAGYYFGMQTKLVQDRGVLSPISETRPFCPTDRVVWGSSNKIYHTPDSKYKGMVTKPDECFTSEQEAKEAGFRPPKS